MRSKLDAVLEAVVTSYIRSGRPVASSQLARSPGIEMSPASIRNMMARLEREGYLYKPHTSGGRIPTDKGYRYYVDNLMGSFNLGRKHRQAIARAMTGRRSSHAVLARIAYLLESFSGQICFVLFPCRIDNEHDRVETGDAISWISGRHRIVGKLATIDETRSLLRVLENPEHVRRILPRGASRGVRIGSENRNKALKGCSLVWSFYKAGQAVGALGFIGPKRMPYAKMMALARYASEYLSRYFGRKGGW